MDDQANWLINIQNTTNEKNNPGCWADCIYCYGNGIMHSTENGLQEHL